MTGQVQDSLHYLGEQHALAAFSDAEPFSPIKAGYRPVMANTACWRGYVCGYEVRDGLLYLRELWVNHQPGYVPTTRCQLPPDLNGVRAVRDKKSFFGEWHFCDVGLPLAYTGGRRTSTHARRLAFSQALQSRSVNTTDRYVTGCVPMTSMPCSTVASNSSESP